VPGSKLNIKLAIKTVEQVAAETRREFHAFQWHEFPTRDEALSFMMVYILPQA